MVKVCTKCCKSFAVSFFYPDLRYSDGRTSWCKKCFSKQRKKNRKRHAVQVKEKMCRVCSIVKLAEEFYRCPSSKDGLNSFCKKCFSAYSRGFRCEYEGRKYKEDELFKIKKRLRGRVRDALKNNQKSGSAIQDLGCSVEDFKVYLESKFESGMSWENYAPKGWHIDHIKPLSSFDLTDRKQFLEACHYTNLQPLWWYDNLSKGNKVE